MNFYKSIPKSIFPLLIVAVILNILRLVVWGKSSFVFILWNIFLSFIPFIISYLLLFFSKKENPNKIIFTIGIFLWILFIPNAPYIITDFIHLSLVRGVPVLFDICLLFSSASVGLILGFNSLFHIEQILKIKYTSKITSLIMGVVILVISFGVYLGRFLRFNSWDIFINHTLLIDNVFKIFTQSKTHIEVYLYTLLFFFFLILSYKSWKFSNIK
jgi:uncharacterized membrane protein